MYREAEVLSKKQTLREMIRKLSKIPLLNHPGEKWHYSVSVDVVGYLVEEFSNQPLDVFFSERIFKPLGMKDTGFYVPENKIDRFVTNYRVQKDESLKIEDAAATSTFSKPTTFFMGGGGLVSTAADYMRFAQMLLNGGELEGVRILSPKTVELMAMNHIDGEFYPGVGFGLGFSVVTDVARTSLIGSEGVYSWSGMANTHFFVDPKEELIALFMAQFFPTEYYPLRSKFRVAVYQAIIK